MQYIATYDSPFGSMTMASNGEQLTGLWFEGQKYFAAGLQQTRQKAQLPIFRQTARWLDCYFGGQEPDFTPPLCLQGTPFRRAVWDMLLKIPYGQWRTYGELAVAIARQRGVATMAAQAVGGAVGHNPISVIVPCHRVIGSQGSLTGYAGGLQRKKQLLALEKVDIAHLTTPNHGHAL